MGLLPTPLPRAAPPPRQPAAAILQTTTETAAARETVIWEVTATETVAETAVVNLSHHVNAVVNTVEHPHAGKVLKAHASTVRKAPGNLPCHLCQLLSAPLSGRSAAAVAGCIGEGPGRPRLLHPHPRPDARLGKGAGAQPHRDRLCHPQRIRENRERRVHRGAGHDEVGVGDIETLSSSCRLQSRSRAEVAGSVPTWTVPFWLRPPWLVRHERALRSRLPDEPQHCAAGGRILAQPVGSGPAFADVGLPYPRAKARSCVHGSRASRVST